MRTDDAHTEAAWFGLAREHTSLPVVARFTIDGEPQSKQRARFSRGHTYTPAKTVAAEQEIAWRFREQARAHQDDGEITYGLTAVFFAATRQRRDVDNMLKLISDGLNGVAWEDDAQVVEMSGRKTFVVDKSEARTEVLIYQVATSDRPRATCVQCGQPYDTYTSWATKRKYCSPKCRADAAAERRRRQCPRCDDWFIAAKGQRYCTDECRVAATTVTKTCSVCSDSYSVPRSTDAQRSHDLCSVACRERFWRERRPVSARGTCGDCGGATSKKQYKRCQACAVAHRATS